MIEFLQKLFESDFMPHGHCYYWQPAILWLHTLSDASIALAYFSIPAALVYFVRRRHDLAFHWVFLMFSLFIFACGATHLMGVWTTWHATYRIEGVLKAVTAVVSVATAVCLWPLIPQALRLPSPSQLRVANQALAREVEERERAEAEVLQLNHDLERRIEERTEELVRSNTELGRFVYIASHDLRAPLQAIDNLSAWLEEDLDEVLEGETREQMEMLRSRVGRMESLLDALLEYSRAGRQRAELERVDLAEVVDDVVDLISLPAGLTVEVASPLPTLETARLPLQQVLMNLVANAIKHHDREDGTIRIAAEERGDFYEISVADDGPGIDPEFHGRIFEMFQTLKPRDGAEVKGMGLAIVQKLVHSHGGTVRVESGPGRGTTFRFTWPRRWWPDDVEELGL